MSKVIRQTYQQTQTRKSNSYEKSSHLRGGGGGGRSHGRKRNYDEDDSIEEVKPDGPSYKTARNSKKELCDLGMSCPYIGEYQHRLEFDHQEIETKNSQSKRNSQGHQIPYYGPGNRLGGYDFRSDRIRSNDHRNDNNSSSATSIKKQKKNNESINYNPVDNLHVICEICHKSVDLFNWDMHALSHERNEREQDTSSIISLVTPIKKSKQIIQKNQFSPRTQLRAEQDQNYEESILEDILKQSKVEYEEYQNSLKHHEVKEDEILNDLLNSTSIHNQPSSSSFRSLKSDPRHAVNLISPKSSISATRIQQLPPYEEISIAFRLPRNLPTTSSSSSPPPNRVIHTFSSHDTIHDIFLYLTSLPFLTGRTDLELHSVLASDGLKLSQQSIEDCHLYLPQAGIKQNTVLIVYDPTL